VRERKSVRRYPLMMQHGLDLSLRGSHWGAGCVYIDFGGQGRPVSQGVDLAGLGPLDVDAGGMTARLKVRWELLDSHEFPVRIECLGFEM
jgi:hypothetical protein